MANVLVYIEITNGLIAPSSLISLNQSRIISTSIGATLYALLPCQKPPTLGNEVVDTLSRHGADRIILVTNPQLSGPATYKLHSAALFIACEQFPPQLIVFPSDGCAVDLSARFALDIGAHYAPKVSIDFLNNEPMLRRNLFNNNFSAEIKLIDAPRPLVITLKDQKIKCAEIMGYDDAEVVVIQSPTIDTEGFSLLNTDSKKAICDDSEKQTHEDDSIVDIVVLMQSPRKTPDAAKRKLEISATENLSLQEALELKKNNENIRVIALNAGPKANETMLRFCKTLGCDEVVRIATENEEEIETNILALSSILAEAIREKYPNAFIFCGNYSSEWGLGIVGPYIAQHLEIDQMSCVDHINYSDIETLIVTSNAHSYKIASPALLSFNKTPEGLPFTENDLSKEQSTVDSIDIHTLPFDPDEVMPWPDLAQPVSALSEENPSPSNLVDES